MKVSLDIDLDQLGGYSDAYLAAAWHTIQHAAGPFGDHDLEYAAERVGREIIRRWLRGIEPELWHRQASHINQDVRGAVLKYEPPPRTTGPVNGGPHVDFHYGSWTLRPDAAEQLAEVNAKRAAALAERVKARGDVPAAGDTNRVESEPFPGMVPTEEQEAAQRAALLAEATRRAEQRARTGSPGAEPPTEPWAAPPGD